MVKTKEKSLSRSGVSTYFAKHAHAGKVLEKALDYLLLFALTIATFYPILL